jgi:hypothetical protein
MPYHFEFDSEHKILVLVADGVADDGEIMTVNEVIAPQVARLRPSAGISDLSRVTKFDVSGDAMRTAARQPSPYPDSIPRFIVAPQEYVFGMARMYELVGYPTRSNLKVVRSMQEALAALGVTDLPKFELVDSK